MAEGSVGLMRRLREEADGVAAGLEAAVSNASLFRGEIGQTLALVSSGGGGAGGSGRVVVGATPEQVAAGDVLPSRSSGSGGPVGGGSSRDIAGPLDARLRGLQAVQERVFSAPTAGDVLVASAAARIEAAVDRLARQAARQSGDGGVFAAAGREL
jgi:hypothetical protein